MQEQIENKKIFGFIAFITPLVCKILETIFSSIGASAEQKGEGLQISFHIKSGEKELEFYLNNLLLEIATIDRDESPLRFDEKLQDFEYFAAKAAKLTDSKMRILFELLSEDDVDKVIDSISEKAKDYQRVRIWKFDELKE
jgi:hypothetical protein